MRKLGPGVYVDDEDGGTMHLDVPELLTVSGFPDTPENRDLMVLAAEEMFAELHTDVDVRERTCRACGCTDNRACPGGCSWVEEDLCSVCAGVRDRLQELVDKVGAP